MCYFGRDEDTYFQQSVNEYEGLCRELQRNMHISDSRYGNTSVPGTSSLVQPDGSTMDISPSSSPVVRPSAYIYTQPPQYSYQEAMWSQMRPWQQSVPHAYGPPSFHMRPPYGMYHDFSFPTQSSVDVSSATHLSYSQQPSEQVEEEDEHLEHHLRDRPRRPPAHYTPDSDAILDHRHRRR